MVDHYFYLGDQEKALEYLVNCIEEEFESNTIRNAFEKDLLLINYHPKLKLPELQNRLEGVRTKLENFRDEIRRNLPSG